MEQETEDIEPMLNLFQFQTAILKFALAYVPAEKQALAQGLFQTGEQFLRPRYRLLIIGGLKIKVSDNFDLDEYLSTMEAAMLDIKGENPTDEQAKSVIKWLRDEIEMSKNAWFEIIASVFTAVTPYIPLPMSCLVVILHDLVATKTITNQDSDEILQEITASCEDSFTLNHVSNRLRDQLCATSSGKVVSKRVMGPSEIGEMAEAGYFLVPQEAEPMQWSEFAKKALACGPSDLQGGEEEENEDTAKPQPDVQAGIPRPITSMSLIDIEKMLEKPHVDEYPEVELPEDLSDEDQLVSSPEGLSHCSLEFARFLQTVQSSPTVLMVPLDQLLGIFDNVACMGTFTREELDKAKRELAKAAEPTVTATASEPVITVALPTVLDIFTRVLGVEVPKPSGGKSS